MLKLRILHHRTGQAMQRRKVPDATNHSPNMVISSTTRLCQEKHCVVLNQ